MTGNAWITLRSHNAHGMVTVVPPGNGSIHTPLVTKSMQTSSADKTGSPSEAYKAGQNTEHNFHLIQAQRVMYKAKRHELTVKLSMEIYSMHGNWNSKLSDGSAKSPESPSTEGLAVGAMISDRTKEAVRSVQATLSQGFTSVQAFVEGWTDEPMKLHVPVTVVKESDEPRANGENDVDVRVFEADGDMPSEDNTNGMYTDGVDADSVDAEGVAGVTGTITMAVVDVN